MSSPVRNELPARSGRSSAGGGDRDVERVQPRRAAGRTAAADVRVVVVVRGAADADVIRAGGRRLEGQLRVASLLVVETPAGCRPGRRRAGGSQARCRPAARRRRRGGSSPARSVTRIEVDLVGDGQEMRHLARCRGRRDAGEPPARSATRPAARGGRAASPSSGTERPVVTIGGLGAYTALGCVMGYRRAESWWSSRRNDG